MKKLIVTALVFGFLCGGLATALTARAGDPPDQKKYAVINPQGTIVNVIVWDGKQPYDPSGKNVTPFDKETQKYAPVPAKPTPTPTATPLVPLTTEERLAKLEAEVAAMKTTLGLK